MNLSFPILNGLAPSWADISATCSFFEGPLFLMSDLKSLDTGASMDIGEQRSGGRVIRRTTGSVSHTASMTMYRSGFQTMLANAPPTAPKRGDVSLITHIYFDLQVQHSFPGPGQAEIYEFILKGCRPMAFTLNGAEGAEADTVDVPLSVSEIIHIVNGRKFAMG